MQHVVHVESSRNPYAIGVVGGYLARQPRNLNEALATVKMLKSEGYNFSVGIAQVNRYNLAKYGLPSYAQAFDVCSNLRAGSRILRECYDRAQDWGKAFSCYYSGNFVTGFEHGYVQKIFASMRKGSAPAIAAAPAGIEVIPYKNSKGNARKKGARDDGVALRASVPASPAPQASAPALPATPEPEVVTMFGGLAVTVPGAYPEPYAVRQHQPAAGIQSPNVSAKAGAVEDIDTTEDRPAIPVPGPGAVMPALSASRSAQAAQPGQAPAATLGAAARAGAAPAKPSSSLADLLAKVPVEVVGVNGDPRQTRLIGPVPRSGHNPGAESAEAAGSARASGSGTAGLPADQLPLPDPNALPASASAARSEEKGAAPEKAGGVEDVGKLVVSSRNARASRNAGSAQSRKGGSLLSTTDAPTPQAPEASAPVFNESSAMPEKTAVTAVPTRAQPDSSTTPSATPPSDGSDKSFVF
ncbi:hypothetical protein NBRC116584_06610 [Hydrogenophaga sp. 5NK40-0174]